MGFCIYQELAYLLSNIAPGVRPMISHWVGGKRGTAVKAVVHCVASLGCISPFMMPVAKLLYSHVVLMLPTAQWFQWEVSLFLTSSDTFS